MSRWFRSRRLPVVAVGLAAALAAATSGCSEGSGTEGSAGDGEAAGWRVDSCIHQVAGPTTIPPDASPEQRQLIEARQVFEPIGCSDDRAVARITHLGAQVEIAQPRPTDDGCPDDTDASFIVEDPISGLERQIVCARNLEPPHPGDPGGGGGNPVVGDCVFVSSDITAGVFNDRVVEIPCDQEGWFATIVALAPDPASCPPEALSRLPSPEQQGEVLCLAPDGPEVSGGTMAAPGECATFASVEMAYPPRPASCDALDDDFEVQRIEAFAEQPDACPDGGESRPVTGYDRELCLG